MRRLALLIAVGATWLFLAALPALADGGPHVASVNNGTSSLTADSCAGCHRVHTAQGPMLLKTSSEETLCVSCHGAASTGATTDVITGVQYVPAANGTRTATELGALRGGGFEEARIDSATPARQIRSQFFAANQWAKVSVGDPLPVTSAHLNLPGNGLSLPTKAWGNGTTDAGPSVAMECGSCHNPHGNNQYRILRTFSSSDAPPAGITGAPTVIVTDSNPDNPDPAESDTKNYTVIQVQGTTGNPATYLLYADDVLDGGYGPTTGDYWHVRVPWDSTTASADAPNGIATGASTSFNAQITAWCSACHTRYYSVAGDEDTGDPIFRYRHETVSNRACTTCHVAHGSNADMSGPSSSAFPYPDSTTAVPDVSSSSRLLKVDNRGTCQLCHDPTHTATVGQYTGPTPTPGRP